MPSSPSRLTASLTVRVSPEADQLRRELEQAMAAEPFLIRRRRHQPTKPPNAKIRPGSPAPAMGSGTGAALKSMIIWSPVLKTKPSKFMARLPFGSVTRDGSSPMIDDTVPNGSPVSTVKTGPLNGGPLNAELSRVKVNVRSFAPNLINAEVIVVLPNVSSVSTVLALGSSFEA
jgi:hypothetical protein